MLIATAKPQSASGASHQPASMGIRLTISHTFYHVHLVHKLVLVFYAPLWLGWCFMVVLLTFFCMVSIALVLWEVAATLRNGCGIRGHNYVAWLQGSKIPVEFHYRSLVLDIYCFKLIILNVFQWSNGKKIELQILLWNCYNVNLLLKTMWGEAEGLMLLFWNALLVDGRVVRWKGGRLVRWQGGKVRG